MIDHSEGFEDGDSGTTHRVVEECSCGFHPHGWSRSSWTKVTAVPLTAEGHPERLGLRRLESHSSTRSIESCFFLLFIQGTRRQTLHEKGGSWKPGPTLSLLLDIGAVRFGVTKCNGSPSLPPPPSSHGSITLLATLRDHRGGALSDDARLNQIRGCGNLAPVSCQTSNQELSRSSLSSAHTVSRM